ncbi:MAG: ribosome maturation factor RimP [Deltaproteobacteria bacterium]|nr:ribosome maturation factor RimP [Deltaproteobacteria bacterium]
MAVDSAVTRVWELAAPLLVDEGMEIVDIEFRSSEGGRGGRVLRVYLDKEGGLNVDDLARVSRRLGDLLDDQVAVEGPYILEVSSPGINRVLKKPEHFRRFIGKRVRVRTREMIEGSRSFLGLLREVREGGIVLSQQGAEFTIPLSVIEKANYEHDWGT